MGLGMALNAVGTMRKNTSGQKASPSGSAIGSQSGLGGALLNSYAGGGSGSTSGAGRSNGSINMGAVNAIADRIPSDTTIGMLKGIRGIAANGGMSSFDINSIPSDTTIGMLKGLRGIANLRDRNGLNPELSVMKGMNAVENSGYASSTQDNDLSYMRNR